MFVKVDSHGDVQNLQFTGVNGRCSDLSFYQFAGFAISPDGSKIIWSNIYKTPSTYIPTSEIYIANTDGSDQKLLLSTQETTTTLVKGIFQWSQEDPNLVYLSNYSWTGSNASYGDTRNDGLSTLNITTGQVELISQIPNTDQVFAVSPDGTKIIHAQDYTLGKHTIMKSEQPIAVGWKYIAPVAFENCNDKSGMPLGSTSWSAPRENSFC
ncbi:MAG TPA: hypothetical protein VMR99_00010 [Candidatus Paceibacterota bacterium]|nr:hypothetical protein [Candidatus Paceibacterota bacterium]